MIESVHIPIYCDNETNKAGALLTLKTIRVGFPTKPIYFYMMDDDAEVHLFDEDITGLVDCKINPTSSNIDLKTNDQLIKYLVETQDKGFAVVDSDMVFFENCEDFDPRGLIAGEFIPKFICPIAKAITYSRLHTAFFVVPDPEKLLQEIDRIYRPVLSKFCPFDPFAPVVTFKDQDPYFHDSCSVLYHAIGGEKFGPNMLRRFEHLYGGSYMTGLHRDRINAAYDNPESARGTREIMIKYFEERKP